MKCFIRLVIFLCPGFAFSQSTYIPLRTKAYDFIDRMEIKMQLNNNLNFSGVKPYIRKTIIKEAEYLDSARATADMERTHLSAVDDYNLKSLLMNNSEWLSSPHPEFQSKKPFLNNFYKTRSNFFELKAKDIFLAINPILNFQVGKQSELDGTLLINSRGVNARGMIANRIGFSTSLTDNQERGPLFFRKRVNQFGAVPGGSFYKNFKNNAFDYFDASGYITFNAAKYIDFQFGYDKNFIGNGYRSLFLSDYASSYLFFKINTRIWKFNYQNIFMELMPQFKKMGIDTLLDRKYAAMHHLSMDVTKWLNIGLFEGITFGRKNHFDFQYLNPIIFYRHIEGTIGSPDNAVAGLDFKANVAHTAQLYGQLLLDEFLLAQIKKNTGYWGNKYAIQLGLKYVDAFKIRNLDLQGEMNIVRPFTYSHNDLIANYTHYNQPLAHPLGGNFREYIGILKYQPKPRIYLNAKMIYYTQGLDSAGKNFGSNPLANYTTRPRDFGFKVGTGTKATCANANFVASYELLENLFVEGSVLVRKFKTINPVSSNTTKMLSLGVRWNIARREYDY